MTLSATLYFGDCVTVSDLLGDLQNLPEPIRPAYFSEDEGKFSKSNMIFNGSRFERFRKKNQNGFFLYADSQNFFDISIRRGGCTEVTLYLSNDKSDDLAVDFIKSFSSRKPVFGFACEEDEYDHRNRHYATLGKNLIESWIGRNLEKYIPGVYWYTLLPDELLSKHDVDLVAVSAEAIATEALLNGSSHLLKFFENPESWKKNAERLDDLCQRTEGVFSRRSVETAISGVSDYLEYSEVIAEWR